MQRPDKQWGRCPSSSQAGPQGSRAGRQLTLLLWLGLKQAVLQAGHLRAVIRTPTSSGPVHSPLLAGPRTFDSLGSSPLLLRQSLKACFALVGTLYLFVGGAGLDRWPALPQQVHKRCKSLLAVSLQADTIQMGFSSTDSSFEYALPAGAALS